MQISGFRVHRTVLALAALSLVAMAASCSSGGSGGGPGPGTITPSFTSSGTGAVVGQVRLANAQDIGGGLMTVDVVINGPVTNADVFSFVFDLIMSDASIVDFISASPGTALNTGTVTAIGQQGLNGSDQAAIVGVSLQNPSPGDNDIPTGDQVICTLTFQVKAVGDSNLTFAGASCPAGIPNCLPTTDPTALDSTGAAISQGTINYDTASGIISGS